MELEPYNQLPGVPWPEAPCVGHFRRIFARISSQLRTNVLSVSVVSSVISIFFRLRSI
jgi:hypothetical protein